MTKIHLTESQLKGMIHEAVGEMINELTYKRMKRAYDKLRKQNRHKEADAMNQTFKDMYGGYIGDTSDGRPMTRDVDLDKNEKWGNPREDNVYVPRVKGRPLRNTVVLDGNTVKINGGYEDYNKYKYQKRDQNPYKYDDEYAYFDDMADRAKDINQWKKGNIDSKDMRTDFAESVARQIVSSLRNGFHN